MVLKLLVPAIGTRQPLPRLLGTTLRSWRSSGLDQGHTQQRIEEAFADLDPATVATWTGRAALPPSGWYKHGLHGDRWQRSAGGSAFRLATHLAASRGVTFDLLHLEPGGMIPPHAHHGVISGMYVVEGSATFRTYDVLAEPDANASEGSVRPRQAEQAGPGGWSTSSAVAGNLHWVLGGAEGCTLFRITISGADGGLGEELHRDHVREYLVPDHGATHADGTLPARVLGEDAAKSTPFPAIAA